MHEGTPRRPGDQRQAGAAAAGRRLRLVQAARPGYEASTPRPGRRVADIAADVAAVLDALGAGDFVVDRLFRRRPALPCLRRARARPLPRRRLGGGRGALCSGRPDFLTGMGPENVEEFGLAIHEDALTPFLEKEAGRSALSPRSRSSPRSAG